LAELSTFRVAVSLPCRRCGYDLRGLAADGRCPECSHEVLETIAATVDPELAALPPLARPRLAGWSLLLTAVGMTVAATAAICSTAAVVLPSLATARNGTWPSWVVKLQAYFPPSMPSKLVAVPPVALAITLGAALVLLRTSEASGWRRWLLPIGLLAWLVASAWPAAPLLLTVHGLCAALALQGLVPIVAALGRRSRTYRQRHAAQQAAGPVTAAIVVGVAATGVGETLVAADLADLATPAYLVAVACLGMTLVGFLYLVGNSLWIWRSVVRWQPLLARVVDRPSPQA
jgi:hypothetical protein